MTPSSLADARRALARGDALRALGLVGADTTAAGLALRGTAQALVGDLEPARRSLRRAERLATARLATARIRAALVAIATSAGDPARAVRAAHASADELARLRDTRSAALQRLAVVRAEIRRGRLDEARRIVDLVLSSDLASDVRAVAALAQAELAAKDFRPTEARRALKDARAALEDAPNEPLARALVALETELSLPLAHLHQRGIVRDADLFAIEAASMGQVVLVDGVRQLVIVGRATIQLATRPVLLAVLVALARAWPSPVTEDDLVRAAFEGARVGARQRSRLRAVVDEVAALLEDAGVETRASRDGYALVTSLAVVLVLPAVSRGARAIPAVDPKGTSIAWRMLLVGLVSVPAVRARKKA